MTIRQFLCGLTGHDRLIQRDDDRIFMKCTNCAHETPGWELNEAPPTPLADATRRVA